MTEGKEEFLAYLVNLKSWFLVKPEIGHDGEICVHASSKFCKKCQQPECDFARGGVPKRPYRWIVVDREKLFEKRRKWKRMAKDKEDKFAAGVVWMIDEMYSDLWKRNAICPQCGEKTDPSIFSCETGYNYCSDECSFWCHGFYMLPCRY